MKQAVCDDDIFGMFEVDIAVPKAWPPEMISKFKLEPTEYFSEMSPLFCTAPIPFDFIGSHMQEHARAHSLSEKNRNLLVRGMRAEKLLLATPLLRWYLDHGMHVSKVYQVVEFGHKKCFRTFVDQISESRRSADKDP